MRCIQLQQLQLKIFGPKLGWFLLGNISNEQIPVGLNKSGSLSQIGLKNKAPIKL
jgi:hypothetical protein